PVSQCSSTSLSPAAYDVDAPAIRSVRRKGIFPARVAECHDVLPIPTDAQRSGANPQWIGNTDAVQANRTRLARRPPADVGLEKWGVESGRHSAARALARPRARV